MGELKVPPAVYYRRDARRALPVSSSRNPLPHTARAFPCNHPACVRPSYLTRRRQALSAGAELRLLRVRLQAATARSQPCLASPSYTRFLERCASICRPVQVAQVQWSHFGI